MNLKNFSKIMIIVSIIFITILSAIIIKIKLHKPPPSTTFSTPNACADPLIVKINNPGDPTKSIQIPKFFTENLSLKKQCAADYSKIDKQKVCNFFSVVDGHIFNSHGSCKDLRRQLKDCGMDKETCNLYTKCCKDMDNLMLFLTIGIFISLIALIFFILIYIRK
jgi:hypothetical protein